jgi:histone-lysine N-methyltransferase SETD3
MLASIEKINPNLKPVNKNMMKWLLDGGTIINKMEINDTQAYRLVLANETILKNDVLLMVPFDMIISTNIVNESDIVKNILKTLYSFRSSHSAYACYLLSQSINELSKWKYYLNALPENYSTVPIYFNQNQLLELQGSMTLKKIMDKITDLTTEYKGICDAYPPFCQFSYEQFAYFRCVVITRIFGFEVNGLKQDGLVPFADMLNHKVEKDTSWYFDNDTNCFTIKSLKKIKNGGEVYDSYGRKCNSRFFVNYGFTLEDNKDDNQALMLFNRNDCESNNVLLNLKLLFLGINNPNIVHDFQVPTDYNYETTQDMFSTLRVLCSSKDEFKILYDDKKLDKKHIDVISVKNETRVLQLIAERATISLSRFKTTMGEDNKILDTPNIDIHLRNAVVMRRSEKEVLTFYKELCEHYYNILNQLGTIDFKKIKKLNNRFKHSNHIYATKCITKLFKNLK